MLMTTKGAECLTIKMFAIWEYQKKTKNQKGQLNHLLKFCKEKESLHNFLKGVQPKEPPAFI